MVIRQNYSENTQNEIYFFHNSEFKICDFRGVVIFDSQNLNTINRIDTKNWEKCGSCPYAVAACSITTSKNDFTILCNLICKKNICFDESIMFIGIY